MDDPFTAVVQRLSRKNSTPVLVALLLAYALVAFGISASVSGVLRFMIGGTALTAFAAALWPFLFKPERLKSEELARMDVVFAWLSRPDVDDATLKAAERILPIVMETKRTKPVGSDGENDD